MPGINSVLFTKPKIQMGFNVREMTLGNVAVNRAIDMILILLSVVIIHYCLFFILSTPIVGDPESILNQLSRV